jgi:hypothetical protein
VEEIVVNERKIMSNKLPIQNQPDGRATDIFCSECLTHERHFEEGHSWTPDLCPCGCQDTTVWYKMSFLKRWKAQKVYNENEIEKG